MINHSHAPALLAEKPLCQEIGAPAQSKESLEFRSSIVLRKELNLHYVFFITPMLYFYKRTFAFL